MSTATTNKGVARKPYKNRDADDRQAQLYSMFPSDTFLGDDVRVDHLIQWITFFRRNLHRCAMDYLGIKLHLYQIIMLAVGHRPIKFPLWMYLMPTLMTAAGIVILATDVKTIESVVVLITGISLVAFAINRLVEMVKIGNEQSQQ